MDKKKENEAIEQKRIEDKQREEEDKQRLEIIKLELEKQNYLAEITLDIRCKKNR